MSRFGQTRQFILDHAFKVIVTADRKATPVYPCSIMLVIIKKSWSFGLTVISFNSSPPKAEKRNEFLIVTGRLQNVQFTFMVGQPTERKLKQDWFQNGFIDCAE